MDVTFEDLNKALRRVCVEDALGHIMERADGDESSYKFETFEQMVEQLMHIISPECDAVSPGAAQPLAYLFLKHRMITAVAFMVVDHYSEETPNLFELRRVVSDRKFDIDFSYSGHEFPRADVVCYYSNEGHKSEYTFENVNLLDAQQFINVV